jgi:transposase
MHAIDSPHPHDPAYPNPALGRVLRVQRAIRNQVELRPCELDATLGRDHQARAVWAFVEAQDLSRFYAGIQTVEGGSGRSPIDPAILLGLWLLATLDGIGSARELARLCESHDAYRWMCGGVGVNHHTLSDFRVGRPEMLDELLARHVAVLAHKGLVRLERVAQDGMRIRASAGASSFRRRETLKEHLRQARAQVAALKQEVEADPAASRTRSQAARERAAREREARVQSALTALQELEQRSPRPSRKRGGLKPGSPQPKEHEPRASTTDVDAHVMKMADGGFRPAYNAQLATDTVTQVIVGVDVALTGSDMGRLEPMVEQVSVQHGVRPSAWLVDGGYTHLGQIDALDGRGTTVYAPVPRPKDPQRDRYRAHRTDTPAVAAWRKRMGSEEGKDLYKERAATAECVNAQARNRGLWQFRVRGRLKALAVLLWYALAHNLRREIALQAA